MARDKRIDELAAVVPATDDLLPLWDTSTSGTKRVTVQQIISLVSSGVGEQTLYYDVTVESNEVTVSALIGRTVKLLLIGGIGSGEVITSGTPTGNQVKFDNTNGKFTKAVGNNFYVGENLTVRYI